MSEQQSQGGEVRSTSAALPQSEVDFALAAQLAVAWAGEGGESPRLGWWRSDLTSEFGGEDLFRRLLPSTWQWAVLQGAREAARRRDTEQRLHVHDPDQITSLFSLGFELDERVEERLWALKSAGRSPADALPTLAALVSQPWSADAFWRWVAQHGTSDASPAPVGRRLKGARPPQLKDAVSRLVAALAPASAAYPLPHFRGTP